jgi:hypothetical protein
MLHVSFDRIASPTGLDQLPIRLEQSTSRGSLMSRLLLLIPALAALAVPLSLLAAHAVAEPESLALLGQHPLTAMQIALGIGLWLALFVYPLRVLIARATTKRLVYISSDRVRVAERGLMRTRTWSAPLSAYRGIAHHVRSSLSGLRHELILVHADADRHVLLKVDDRISQTALEKAASLLQLPQVSARNLYGPAPRGASLPRA